MATRARSPKVAKSLNVSRRRALFAIPCADDREPLQLANGTMAAPARGSTPSTAHAPPRSANPEARPHERLMPRTEQPWGVDRGLAQLLSQFITTGYQQANSRYDMTESAEPTRLWLVGRQFVVRIRINGLGDWPGIY